MTDVKTYECKRCKDRGKEYKGSRGSVRKHLREEHRVKGTSFVKKGRQKSNVTLDTISKIMD